MAVPKKQKQNKQTTQTRFWQRWPWLRRPESFTAYIETNTDNGTTLQQTQQQATPLNNVFHRSYETLLYITMVKILLTNDLTLLMISGEAPSVIILEATFRDILNEYLDATRNERSDNVFTLWNKMLFIKWKIIFVDAALMALKFNYDEQIAMLLVEQGYDAVEPLEDRSAYLTQIYLIQTEAKNLIVQLNQLNIEYNLICPSATRQDIRTQLDYEKEIKIIERFMGQRFDRDKLTCMEFATCIILYNEMNKKQQTENK